MKADKPQADSTQHQRVAQALPVEPPLHGGPPPHKGKTLYLVRHAKSSWADMGLDDFDRPLNKRGLRDAPEMGKRLKKRKILPDVIISSPARRAINTAEIIAKEVGFPAKRSSATKRSTPPLSRTCSQ